MCVSVFRVCKIHTITAQRSYHFGEKWIPHPLALHLQSTLISSDRNEGNVRAAVLH